MENPISKHVGIWIRVSTEDQAHGESPEHHERRGDFRGSHTAPDQLRPLSARSPHDKNNLKSDAALQLPLRTERELKRGIAFQIVFIMRRSGGKRTQLIRGRV